MPQSFSEHTLLVANRGEIAVRILRTAKALGMRTLAVYTRTDATAPHVALADGAVALRADDADPTSNARGYLDAGALVQVARDHGATLVHPGYGFLAENAEFARALEREGISWVGPDADTIHTMGLKHEARAIALRSGVPVVPGSDGLVKDVDVAVETAKQIGYPVMIKSTAGGGGMGLVVCKDEGEVREKFMSTQARAKSLFHNDGLFLERYFPAARHIEIQIFGDGLGNVVHMGERECSVQRRYQKVIEETSSPFFMDHPGLREDMCAAAIRLCQEIKYASAGTVEFIVDDSTAEFYFLEMNTRIQVEHTVTEAAHPGLDIVALMLRLAAAQRGGAEAPARTELLHERPCATPAGVHALEVRIYCENASAGFAPAPGVLQHVAFPERDWLRVETWVETGTAVTPFFDPLVAKLVVAASTRGGAIARLEEALRETKIQGPPNNIAYVHAICQSEPFKSGKATTKFLDTFEFTPHALDVLHGGLETTVQEYPGRRLGRGIPRSGPMDALAFRAANILVGNAPGVEALELTLVGCQLRFHVPAVVAVTGADASVTADGAAVPMWGRICVPAGATLAVGTVAGPGLRVYVAVKGGFPEVPAYLGSKATSMGLGGYQGRALTAGDQLALGDCAYVVSDVPSTLTISLRPAYPSHWTIYCLAGPHCDEEFLTTEGIRAFFDTHWKVSASSNRMGIRLEGSRLAWARATGGEGGSHPSNIHDTGYALGTVNVNGDTPVILTNEGPDMGGYVCLCTVASAELWKLGQLRPGNTIHFKRISFDQAMELSAATLEYLDHISLPGSMMADMPPPFLSAAFDDTPQDPKLCVIPSDGPRPKAVFRQAGDAAILLEYGEPRLDFHVRARVHAFENEVRARDIPGIWSLAPCIRSTMIHFDPAQISQRALLTALAAADAALPDTMHDLTFRGRRVTFPLVPDDRWSRDALVRYARTVRAEAAYLPSNVAYLARNNGLPGGSDEALHLLSSATWLVCGVGFYLACPFLVPLDPRARLVAQKMNPSRTHTPRGAVGIAGLVAAIYPVASPGGYQLFGRTLPPWQTWPRGGGGDGGDGGNAGAPGLLRPFDQVVFRVVSEEEYVEMEQRFDAGQYVFEIEETTFSMADYQAFVDSVQDEVQIFKKRQAEGVAREEACEAELLAAWQREREDAQAAGAPTLSSDDEDTPTGGATLTSPLTASVWKLAAVPGHVVRAADDVLLVLEAMKTEVPVAAGAAHVGRTVRAFARGVRPGALVQAGDALVVFE